jgi:glycosyltransferase involved in cell wall biosynthesis
LRRSLWALRVLLAAMWGWPPRLVRRLLHRPPRIWHGIRPLHAVTASVKADRRAGFPSQSVVMQPRQDRLYALTNAGDFDVVAETLGYSWDSQHWACLCHLLRHGDIWNTSFQPFFSADRRLANELVFRMIRLVGIKIIAFPFGTDVAYRDRYRDRYDWVGRLQADYSDWDLERWGETTRGHVDLYSRHAHLVVGMDSSVSRFLTRNDLHFKGFPVDTERIQPSVSVDRARPLVIHATNHRRVKGTDVLIDCVQQLQAAGVECELVLVERVDRDAALRLYSRADVIADQFVMGAYGVFALEGLACAKPVMTFLDAQHLANPVFNLPLVNTTHANMRGVLAALLRVRELRDRIGRFSREQVAKYQSVDAMAEVWKQIYDHLWWGSPLELEATRHFSPERTARSFSEDPSDPEFWPVDVSDLIPAIREAMQFAGAMDGAGPRASGH